MFCELAPRASHRAAFDRPTFRSSISTSRRYRNAAAIFTVGSVILLFLTVFGSFQAYEATESVGFCGQPLPHRDAAGVHHLSGVAARARPLRRLPRRPRRRLVREVEALRRSTRSMPCCSTSTRVRSRRRSRACVRPRDLRAVPLAGALLGRQQKRTSTSSPTRRTRAGRSTCCSRSAAARPAGGTRRRHPLALSPTRSSTSPPTRAPDDSLGARHRSRRPARSGLSDSESEALTKEQMPRPRSAPWTASTATTGRPTSIARRASP